MPARPAASAPSSKAKRAAAPAPAWLRAAILGVTALLLLGWLSTASSDPDMWWHLKTGQYIWEHRAMPLPDPFAYTTYLKPPLLPGEAVARDFNLTHEWLVQVPLYLLHSAGGFPAIVLLRSVLLAAVCGLVGLRAWRRSGSFYRALAVTLFTAVVARQFGADRPFLVTYLLLAALLAVLEYRRWMWLLPPLFVIWANCHGGFVVGWAALGAHCAESLFLRWRGNPQPGDRPLWLVTAASILASGLNPNGFRVLEVLAVYRSSPMQSTIWEWQRTNYWELSPFTVMLYGGLAALLWARSRARLSDWLLFTAFAVSALAAVRNVPLMALVAPVIIAAYAPGKNLPFPRVAQFATGLLLVAAVACVAAAGRGFQYRAVDWQYPAGAADFLLRHRVTGRMFNSYTNGGYLMWRLWPRQRVFIDGRALSEAVYRDYQRIIMNADATGGPTREELLSAYGVDVLVLNGFELVNGEAYLLPAALADPAQKEWKLVYQDAQAAVFMRHPPEGVEPLNPLLALASMDAQCEDQIGHGHPACARSLAMLYSRIGDARLALRWINAWRSYNREPDADIDSLRARLLAARPAS